MELNPAGSQAQVVSPPVLGPIPFNIFIDGLGEGPECVSSELKARLDETLSDLF